MAFLIKLTKYQQYLDRVSEKQKNDALAREKENQRLAEEKRHRDIDNAKKLQEYANKFRQCVKNEIDTSTKEFGSCVYKTSGFVNETHGISRKTAIEIIQQELQLADFPLNTGIVKQRRDIWETGSGYYYPTGGEFRLEFYFK